MDLKTLIDAVKNSNGNEIDLDGWDEETQIKMVKSTSDQLVWAYFVNNSKYKYIQSLALDKIDDEEILMDIALNNECTYDGDYEFRATSIHHIPVYYNSEKAFSKINDKHKLIEIVKSIDHELNNLNHLKRFIHGDDAWADIAVDAHMDYHKIFALKKIKSRNVFIETVAKCDINKILLRADRSQDDRFKERAKAITDEDYLKSIVLTGRDGDDIFKNVFLTYKNRRVRSLAIAQITDEDFLKEVAHDEDKFFRLKAVGKIHDENFLKSVALNDENEYVRKRALKNIHDENFLKSVALNDEDRNIRESALENIHDDDFLKSVALNDENEYVRRHALENIHDENFLKSVALEDENWRVRKSAIENIHDENFLKSVALNDEEEYVRSRAIENIHDEDFLKSVALNDEEEYVRSRAIENISDTDILKDILANRKDEFEVLIDLIDDEDFMKSIVRDDDNYSNEERLHALKNIHDIDFLRLAARYDYGIVCKYASLKTGEYDIIRKRTYDNFPKDLLYEALHDNINNEIAIELMEYVDERDVTQFIEEMTDDETFLRVLDRRCPKIRRDCNGNVFYRRLRNVSDDVMLKHIFLNGENEELRRWAASKVDDEEFFKDTFFKSDEIWLKAVALERIHDQDLLRHAAQNCEDPLLKSSALANIVDGDFLKGIYFNADCDEQKDAIISKTDDVDICTDYALTGGDSKLKREACKRITDETLLKGLFFSEQLKWLREVISKNIHDDDFFMEIINGNYDKDFKYTALRAIENNENLAKVAHDFTDPELSKSAIDLIKDESTLRSICERTPTCQSDEEIIEHARKHLYDLFFKSDPQIYMI